MLFCDRKPRCPEAQCFEKLDRVSLDGRVRIFRYAEMNGDFTPSLHHQLDLRVVPITPSNPADVDPAAAKPRPERGGVGKRQEDFGSS